MRFSSLPRSRARLGASAALFGLALVGWPAAAFAQDGAPSPADRSQVPPKDAPSEPASPPAAPASPNGGLPVDTSSGAPGARGPRLVGPGSRDDQENHAGLVLGLRIGAALPSGNVESGRPIRERTSYAVPLALHLGGFVTSTVYLGGYAQYDFASADAASSSSSSSNTNATTQANGPKLIHLGAQGELAPFGARDADVIPWIGLSLGYAYLDMVSSHYGALEATVPVGVDIRLGPSARVGFFVSQSAGTTFAAIYGWTTFGLRAVLE